MTMQAIKEAIQKTIIPILAGIRNDLEELKIRPDPKTIVISNFPEKIKAEVENWPEQKEIARVEVINHPEPIREIEIKNLKENLSELQTLPEIKECIQKFLEALREPLERMIVVSETNARELVDTIVRASDNKQEVQKVEVVNHPELPVITIPDTVRIENQNPSEAIPARFVSKDGRRFYDLEELLTGYFQEINLENVKKLLQQITDNTDTLEIKIQSVRDQLDVFLSTRASEATLIQIRDFLDTVEIKLQTLVDQGALGGSIFQTKTILLNGNQTTSILTPAAGKRLRVLGTRIAQEVKAADAMLKFQTSNRIVDFIASSDAGYATTSVRIEGAINESLTAIIANAASGDRWLFTINYEEF